VRQTLSRSNSFHQSNGSYYEAEEIHRIEVVMTKAENKKKVKLRKRANKQAIQLSQMSMELPDQALNIKQFEPVVRKHR